MEIDKTIQALKNVKTSSDIKWLYNFAAKILQDFKEKSELRKYQETVNIYYKQHYEQYYNNNYRKLTEEQKQKYNEDSIERNKKKKYYQKQMKIRTEIFKLYNQGKLPEVCENFITQHLESIDINKYRDK